VDLLCLGLTGGYAGGCSSVEALVMALRLAVNPPRLRAFYDIRAPQYKGRWIVERRQRCTQLRGKASLQARLGCG
jgi:hypothetical protein